MEKVKTAFYLALGRALESEQVATQPFPGGLLVFQGGFAFKLVLHVPRQLFLLAQPELTEDLLLSLEAEEDGPPRAPHATSAALPLHVAQVLRPHVAAQLQALHQRSPSFGPTTRLVKRWLDSHLTGAGTHWDEEGVELLVAASFLRGDLAPWRHALTHLTYPPIPLVPLTRLAASSECCTCCPRGTGPPSPFSLTSTPTSLLA